MSPVEPRPAVRREETAERRERTLAVAIFTVCASFVALWPYTSVISAGGWSLVSVMVILVVAATGFVVRQLRAGRADRVWSTLVAQVLVAIMTLTALAFSQGAIFAVIPTRTTLTSLGRHASEAFEQVQYGTAPLEATPALGAMLGIGFAVIAILLDQLISQRITLIAAILVATVGAMPMIITLGDANVPWFVMLALLTLFLLRHSIRHDRTSPRRASLGVTVSLGAAAIVAALVITPALPVSATWIGVGTSVQLNPSLRLGDDLRRPNPFTVMTLATSTATAPYLRIASLSQFDGETWTPDESDVQPLSDGFGAPDWADNIETVEKRTSIRVSGISSPLLPVPFPATKIIGLSSGWTVMLDNRTVVSESRDAEGQDYTVTTQTALPSREQIQAATTTSAAAASAAAADESDDEPAEDLPPVIAETAREVTADAATDYDKLITLQNWFRSQFSYSLEAPVDGGFDGTGAEAVAEFLDVRSGYCIHFAGAFALMAQSLDMQVRVVVGYLPGRPTDEKRGDESIFTVSSEQLHAWPEVHFEGIGWVPFEPTASLGVPTNFAAAATEGGSGAGPTTPAPSAAPSTAPTSGPELDRDQGGSSTADGQSLQRLDPTPVLLITGGALLALLMPALIRFVIRLRRRIRARRGDAMSAWQEVRDTLIDLRLPVSEAHSPRARGAALVQRGVDAEAMHVLVDAVESISYARTAGETGNLSPALARVTADLRRSVDLRVRVAAVLAPRALFIARGSRGSVLA
ncbi:transglutaminaseTgpA domain-containing protein [Microbacterium sp. A84]|uniref:transglutaminase family protein n=1 Tax=Microbacterium sp. A84 TaxID=3450715 RepID=UPI003F444C1F